MANSSLTLSSLDFDTLKDNFKEFLKTQSVFKDYDYDGSNISVLLDVMAYNSYLNSFYLNMVASEMFLDTAQKYDSVISHAKELNYIPRSSKSSSAELSLTFETVGVQSLTIPKGTRFTGTNSNGVYTFTTNESRTLTSSNSTFSVANLQIYEGDYFNDSYLVDYDIENQQFLISNRNVDTDSISVNVIENNGANNTEFTKVATLFGLDENSEIYFLQGSHNRLYEVSFGDGLFGRKPLNASTILINYRICSGENSNGIKEFILADDLEDTNSGTISLTNLTVTSNSAGGSSEETIESIRFSAPRYFATQQRAVSSDDYASLILSNFGGDISDVTVYGGQDVEPKQYGRVIVSLKPNSGTIAPDYVKNKINNYLQDYIAIPNRIVITDPDFIYCAVSSKVQYNPNITTKTTSELQTIISSTISNYSSNNLELFGNDLRYSRLTYQIDNSDTSIISNDTDIRVMKKVSPVIGQTTNIDFSFGNRIRYIVPPTNQQQPLNHPPMFISSSFVYTGTDGVDYNVQMQDNGRGIVYLFTTNSLTGDVYKIDENIGEIDYTSGTVNVNLNIKSYEGQYINFYARTYERDIFANNNRILMIDPADVSVSVIEIIE